MLTDQLQKETHTLSYYVRHQYLNEALILFLDPPAQPFIRQTSLDGPTSATGPYNTGEKLQLYCINMGGNPKPSLYWLRDMTPVEMENVKQTREDNLLLTIAKLTIEDDGTLLTCKATQEGLQSVTTTVRIKVKGMLILNQDISNSVL